MRGDRLPWAKTPQAIAIWQCNNLIEFDLNGDRQVDFGDRLVWIDELKKTWIGDANLDLELNSGDLVQVFVKGKYETGETAGWEEGDWDGNTRFDSTDMVAAFVRGCHGYEGARRPDLAAIPEPGGWVLLILGMASLLTVRRG